MNRVIFDWFKIWVVWVQMMMSYSHVVIGQTIGDGQSIDEEHQIEIEGCESRKRSIFTNFAETEIEVDLRTSCHSCCCSNMTNQVSSKIKISRAGTGFRFGDSSVVSHWLVPFQS